MKPELVIVISVFRQSIGFFITFTSYNLRNCWIQTAKCLLPFVYHLSQLKRKRNMKQANTLLTCNISPTFLYGSYMVPIWFLYFSLCSYTIPLQFYPHTEIQLLTSDEKLPMQTNFHCSISMNGGSQLLDRSI